jgi:large subunit ribosomal protein L23
MARAKKKDEVVKSASTIEKKVSKSGAFKATIKDFDTLLRPMVTEKSMFGLEHENKITMEVLASANKTAVKLAFEAVYNVKVKHVNIVNVRPKATRRGRHLGTISGFKKAVITLDQGQALDLFKE